MTGNEGEKNVFLGSLSRLSKSWLIVLDMRCSIWQIILGENLIFFFIGWQNGEHENFSAVIFCVLNHNNFLFNESQDFHILLNALEAFLKDKSIFIIFATSSVQMLPAPGIKHWFNQIDLFSSQILLLWWNFDVTNESKFDCVKSGAFNCSASLDSLHNFEVNFLSF